MSCVPLTNVVLRVAPFHWISVPDTNPEPVTVSANAAPPAVTAAGDSIVRLGAGELITVNVARPI